MRGAAHVAVGTRAGDAVGAFDDKVVRWVCHAVDTVELGVVREARFALAALRLSGDQNTGLAFVSAIVQFCGQSTQCVAFFRTADGAHPMLHS